MTCPAPPRWPRSRPLTETLTPLAFPTRIISSRFADQTCRSPELTIPSKTVAPSATARTQERSEATTTICSGDVSRAPAWGAPAGGAPGGVPCPAGGVAGGGVGDGEAAGAGGGLGDGMGLAGAAGGDVWGADAGASELGPPTAGAMDGAAAGWGSGATR